MPTFNPTSPWYFGGRALESQDMDPMSPMLAKQGGFNYANLIAALLQANPAISAPSQDPNAGVAAQGPTAPAPTPASTDTPGTADTQAMSPDLAAQYAPVTPSGGGSAGGGTGGGTMKRGGRVAGPGGFSIGRSR